MILTLAFLIGFFAGLRSLTAPAAVAWAVHFNWLKIEGALAHIGSGVSVIILSVLAVAEFVADKLPNTPSRTAPVGLIARIVTGGLCGACVALGGDQSGMAGAALGSVGGVTGCFLGYFARTRIVKALRVPDIYVAIFEDLIAIAGSLWVVSNH